MGSRLMGAVPVHCNDGPVKNGRTNPIGAIPAGHDGIPKGGANGPGEKGLTTRDCGVIGREIGLNTLDSGVIGQPPEISV